MLSECAQGPRCALGEEGQDARSTVLELALGRAGLASVGSRAVGICRRWRVACPPACPL